MSRFDQYYAQGQWDAVIRYEDFIARKLSVVEQMNALGWECDPSYWDARRSLTQIREFNVSVSPWCERHFENGWGFGNIRSGPISQKLAARPDQPDVTHLVADVSPRIFAAYETGIRCEKM